MAVATVTQHDSRNVFPTHKGELRATPSTTGNANRLVRFLVGPTLPERAAPPRMSGDGVALAGDFTQCAPTATQEPTMADNRNDRSLTDQGVQDSAEGKLD